MYDKFAKEAREEGFEHIASFLKVLLQLKRNMKKDIESF